MLRPLAFAGALALSLSSAVAAPRHMGAPKQLSGGDMLDAARRFLGARNPTGFRGQWCGAFMGMIARRSGRSMPANPNLARAWARAGRPTTPHIGAIAVMAHHVGIIAGFKHVKILLVSGNHSHRVGQGWYSASRVIAYRSV
jgi:uncharacterized protein (TIGR02594 family)